MIKAVIIDDEPDAITALTNLIREYCSGIEVCGAATAADVAIELINSIHPDVVFLDIEMPGQDGFEILKRVGKPIFQVVFVTAYNRYALDAIKASAVDYLLKPVDIDDLRSAVEKIQKGVQVRSASQGLGSLIHQLSLLSAAHNKIAVPTIDGLEFISAENILYCRAEGQYTRLELTTGRTILSSYRIGEYENLLPLSLFCRVHNSYVINLRHIDKYMKGRGGSIVMNNGKIIEVSTRRRDTFLELFASRKP